MSKNHTYLPPEIISNILSHSTNVKDQLVCKDWYSELEYQRCLTLNNPDKFINELHPNIKFLLFDFDHRRKILRLIGERRRLDLLDSYKDFFAKDWFLEKAFKISCMNNYEPLIEFFISKGFNDWNKGMKYASRGGHKDLVLRFISDGADKWINGIKSAALGGHFDLVEFFIEKGADDWEWGMKKAAQGEHKDLVDFFIFKGAKNWNQAMMYAARGGHMDLVDFFISKGAYSWNLSMCYAAKGGTRI